jgi:hypothetical protein
MTSQGKNFSEGIEEYMRQYGDNQTQEQQEQPKQLPQKPLTPLDEEFEQFAKERINPVLDKQSQITIEEGRQLNAVSRELERVNNNIKCGLKRGRIVVFAKVSDRDKTEISRKEGLKIGNEYREKVLRYELMQALSGAHILLEEKDQQDPEAQLKEEELLALMRQEEDRRRKLHL